MTHVHFLRIKRLTNKNHIQIAAKHNHREILGEMGAAQDSHIDPSRTSLNIVLRGHSTAAGVASAAQSLMDDAGVKTLRKDAVRALEIIFSLPPESTIEHRRYFEDATKWTENYFKAPVISAIIHNDEAARHCHVLILPLVDGRMVGSGLHGGKTKLLAMQADFHANVGQGYGLARRVPQKRLSATIRRQAIELAFNVLEANSGLTNTVLSVIVNAFKNNPEPLMRVLGLDMPKEKIKGTFAGIMTKPCKPEKPIGFTRSKPIGFDAVATHEKEQNLCSVGFTPSAQPISAGIAQQDEADQQTGIAPVTTTSQRPAPEATVSADQPDIIEETYTRHHDADQPAGYWDESQGEFIKPTVKASCKLSVTASVNAALESIGVSTRALARVMRC